MHLQNHPFVGSSPGPYSIHMLCEPVNVCLDLIFVFIFPAAYFFTSVICDRCRSLFVYVGASPLFCPVASTQLVLESLINWPYLLLSIVILIVHPSNHFQGKLDNANITRQSYRPFHCSEEALL